MVFLAEAMPQFNLLELIQVAGTPGMMLVLYVVWWRTVGKEQAEERRKTAESLQRTSLTLNEVASNLYRLHDKTENHHESADQLLHRGERIVERLDERFPSGVINPPKPVGA